MQRKLKRNRIREREKESGLINGTWCCKIFHMYQCVHLIFKWYRRNKPAHNCGSPILVTTTAKLFALLSCCLELMCRLNIVYCVYLLLHRWTECTSFSPAACLSVSVSVSVSPSHASFIIFFAINTLTNYIMWRDVLWQTCDYFTRFSSDLFVFGHNWNCHPNRSNLSFCVASQ